MKGSKLNCHNPRALDLLIECCSDKHLALPQAIVKFVLASHES